MFKIVAILPLMTGCTISGGLGIHDKSFDSEFTEDKYVAWVQGDAHLNDVLKLYARHESMPRIAEKYTDNPGHGSNTAGAYLLWDLR